MAVTKTKKTKAARASLSQTQVTQGQLDELIRKKAQELYERNSRKPGHDLDNWLEAERIIKKQMRLG